MAFIGALEAFDGNDFEPYQEHLESYFLANDIGVIEDENNEQQKIKADKKKVAYAIAVMGKATYNILKDLCLPAKPTDKQFEEICQLLKVYYFKGTNFRGYKLSRCQKNAKFLELTFAVGTC